MEEVDYSPGGVPVLPLDGQPLELDQALDMHPPMISCPPLVLTTADT